MRCAKCYHDLHPGKYCPVCNCWTDPVGSPHHSWEAPTVVIEADHVTYCEHGNDEHCHLCAVSSNFRALTLALFILIGIPFLVLYLGAVL